MICCSSPCRLSQMIWLQPSFLPSSEFSAVNQPSSCLAFPGMRTKSTDYLYTRTMIDNKCRVDWWSWNFIHKFDKSWQLYCQILLGCTQSKHSEHKLQLRLMGMLWICSYWLLNQRINPGPDCVSWLLPTCHIRIHKTARDPHDVSFSTNRVLLQHLCPTQQA